MVYPPPRLAASWDQDRTEDLAYLSTKLTELRGVPAGAGAPLGGTVPRHLRRRTRSHNRIQLPLRLRLKPLVKLVALPQRCRKFRRTRSRLRVVWSGRGQAFAATGALNVTCASGSTIRLPTHSWCAKRMHMQDLWGFRLPVHLMDKGERAVLRVRNWCLRKGSAAAAPTMHCFPLFAQACQDRCIAHDMSYWTPIRLSGSSKALINLLSSMEVRSSIRKSAEGDRVNVWPLTLLGTRRIQRRLSSHQPRS